MASQEVALRASETTLEVERQRFMPVMTTAIALERRSMIAEAVKNILIEATKDRDGDYGVIPGSKKPTLLQPGAQKLDNLFGLVPRYSIERADEDWTGERHGGEPFFRYMVRCQCMRGDFVMGEGIGECNSWESKYRYRTADRACPNCGAGAIIKTKKKTWWCAPFKGGCNQGFGEADKRITDQQIGKKPNPEIFDQVNTLLKMAEKRAHMLATINATSASEFFTQDLEDRPEVESEPIQQNTDAEQSALAEKRIAEEKSRSEKPRPVPEELQLAFKHLDEDYNGKTIGDAFKLAEAALVARAQKPGLDEYNRIVKEFRAKYPKGADMTKPRVEDCLLDLWDALQKFPDTFAASDSDLPPALQGKGEGYTCWVEDLTNPDLATFQDHLGKDLGRIIHEHGVWHVEYKGERLCSRTEKDKAQSEMHKRHEVARAKAAA